MQKKLEAELISIAHRILKLKNKSELDQLYLETGKLYEKLAVLKFLETHFSGARPTIGHAEVSDKLAVVFDSPEAETVSIPVQETAKPEEGTPATETPEAPVPQEEITEEVPAEEIPDVEEPEAEHPEKADDADQNDEAEADQVIEQLDTAEEEAKAADEEHEIQETEEQTEENPDQEAEDGFKPSFELSFEKKEDAEKKAPQQISFEDLLGGHDYTDDIFEKVGVKKTEEKIGDTPAESAPSSEQITPEPVKQETSDEIKPEVPQYQSAVIDKSEYEKPLPPFNGKTITFGLNDRIGFEKNLFGGSSEDMNRVISQLNTFNSFQEAQDFIEDMVKPDYNDWENKDDYAKRFMEIVEKKFA